MHGWGGNLESFATIPTYFSKNYRVTVVDFYGFGETPHPTYPLFVDDYADGIVELIEHYNMQKATLICHSFGGRVGILLAFKRPELIEKLVLTSSAGVKPRRGLKYYFKIYRHKLLKKLNIPHKAGSGDYRKLSPIMRQTFKNVVNDDLTCALDKIFLSTLLIWGSKDKDTPIYMAKKMLSKISDSGLIIFKGAGHFAYLTNLGAFCAVTERFLEGKNEVDNSKPNANLRDKCIVKIPDARSKRKL